MEFENYIVGEQIIKIEHCLLGVPGGRIEAVSYTHLDVYKRQVLRLHSTQPKDRRVYTPLTGSSAWPEPTAERKKVLIGQEAWA